MSQDVVKDIVDRESGGTEIRLSDIDAVETPVIHLEEKENPPSQTKRSCCEWAQFQGKKKAQGFAFAATGHGSVIISNALLSTSFVLLAHKEVGCIDRATKTILRDCDVRIHGFYPGSLVTNIAAIAALMAAFFLPVIGAIIDYTPHRKRVGQVVAFLMLAIQATQIATNENTWFPMAILQAIISALFEMHFMLASSYLPDLARYDIDAETFNVFNRTFYGLQFGGEIAFLVLVVAISTLADLDTVVTAQVSQIIASLWLIVCFGGAWRRFPEISSRHHLPAAHSNLFKEGLQQNWRTFNAICKHSKSLSWFFTTVIVGEAGITALLPVVISLMTNVYQYNANDIGTNFMLALVASLFGVMASARMSRSLNPITNLTLALVGAATSTIVGMLVLTGDNWTGLGRILTVMWGFFLGWWYSGEQLMFSLMLPAGQESELSGFYVYCTIILTWVPPVVYTILVENGIHARFGLGSLLGFQLLAIATLRLMPSWDEVVEEAKTPLKLAFHEDTALEEKAHSIEVPH